MSWDSYEFSVICCCALFGVVGHVAIKAVKRHLDKDLGDRGH